MNVILIILAVWAAVTLAIAVRLYFIAMFILANVGIDNLTSSRLKYAYGALADAARWPFYILWFGLKGFLNDLKK